MLTQAGATSRREPLPEPCLQVSLHTALQLALFQWGSVVPARMDVVMAPLANRKSLPPPSGHDPFPPCLGSPSRPVDVCQFANMVHLLHLFSTDRTDPMCQVLNDFRTAA